MSSRRIAVIGAGPSGLAAMKCCKEEGLAVTCFEKTDNYGGRWRYRNKPFPGVASVMKSAVSIYSKEMMAFSDFPPPKEFPIYLHHTKVLEYLYLYGRRFDLLQHIKYHHEVIGVVPAADFLKSGKWLVKILNIENGTETIKEFHGVMVCSGRLSHAFIPSSIDKDNFEGKIMHTQSLASPMDFENMNVVIVGNGNSAMDAAVDISTLAKQVYLSTRKGTWILPKVGPKGLPYDMTLLRKHFHIVKQYFSSVANSLVEKYLETKIQHDVYRLKPDHRVLENRPVINDIIPDKILTGRVRIKGAISRYEKNGIFFEEDEAMIEADAVIFATGYETKIPFLNEKIYRTSDGKFNIFKNVFPIGLKHPTLALIGFVESQGPLGPISESQSRLVARVFSRKLDLQLPTLNNPTGPTESSEPMNIKNKQVSMVDYIEYMDELAEEYGAKPNLSLLLFKDPYLFGMTFTGPFLSYQYRISGPHSWDGARRAITECHNRVVSAFSTRKNAHNCKDDYDISESKKTKIWICADGENY